MTGRQSVCLVACLALAAIVLYAWSMSTGDRSHLLAEDALRAARNSVHEAMQFLLDAYEDQLRTNTARNVTDPKLERLQASLDNLYHQESSPQSPQLSDPRYVHSIDLCAPLAGKRITMVGSEYIHRLHVHLLRHRELAEGKPFPCPYHEFCTHHHVCLPYNHLQDDIPPPRYIKPPTTQELIATESAVINYVVSDTLFSSENEYSVQYTSPYVDPLTGVRLRETYWLPAARKANIVMLGRGPLSPPGETYTGNWSFLRSLPDYVAKSSAAGAAAGYENRDDGYPTVPRSPDILNAAVHLTVVRFLPDVVQVLQAIRRNARPSTRKRIIWPSNWYRLPGRGAARMALLRPHARSKVQDRIQRTVFHRRRTQSSVEHFVTEHLSVLIHADDTNTARREDPWTLLYNTQVYLQNTVLRVFLPRHGIVFLPLDVPWVDAHGQGDGYSHGIPMDADLELKRMLAVGDVFLMALDYILGFLE